jgi:hypothetical protein
LQKSPQLLRDLLGAFPSIEQSLPTRDEIRALWAGLKPVGYGNSWNSEPWEIYWPRVRHLIPNFPDVAAQQWLWRHYTSVLEFDWLWLPDLNFTLESWPLSRILAEIQGWPNHGLIESWTNYLRTNPQAENDWLVAQMVREGTWPQPPMVIENTTDLQRPDGFRLSAPFQLMEGHHRLGFLRALADTPEVLKAMHDILLVRIPQSAVLDYYPLNEGA